MVQSAYQRFALLQRLEYLKLVKYVGGLSYLQTGKKIIPLVSPMKYEILRDSLTGQPCLNVVIGVSRVQEDEVVD